MWQLQGLEELDGRNLLFLNDNDKQAKQQESGNRIGGEMWLHIKIIFLKFMRKISSNEIIFCHHNIRNYMAILDWESQPILKLQGNFLKVK